MDTFPKRFRVLFALVMTSASVSLALLPSVVSAGVASGATDDARLRPDHAALQSGSVASTRPRVPAVHYDYPGPPGVRVVHGTGTKAARGVVSGTPPLTYPANSNNPVQHHPRIYLIFWGPNWTSTDAIITSSKAMFTNIAGTAYNAILTQYYSQNSTGTKTFISNDAQLAGTF
jgi:hypothetical protein